MGRTISRFSQMAPLIVEIASTQENVTVFQDNYLSFVCIHTLSCSKPVVLVPQITQQRQQQQQIEGYILRGLHEAFLPMSSISVMSYTSFANSDAKFLGEMFLNSDQTSALMLFTVTSPNRTFVRATTRNLLFFLRAELPTFDTRNGLFTLNVTGYEALLADTLSSVKSVCIHPHSFFFAVCAPLSHNAGAITTRISFGFCAHWFPGPPSLLPWRSGR